MTEEPVPFLSDSTGQEHPLAEAITTIGRAVENSIVVTSKRISREHARIRQQGRRMFLEDLGSTNGTFLNNERLLAPVELRDGDHISIGAIEFIFHDPDTTTRENPFPELEVDAMAGVARVNRRAVDLSPKEFALLVHLYERRGKVCSKDDIGQVVWPEYQSGVYDYQIENLVRRLRTKIENDPAAPQLLVTVRGLGYKLLVQAE